MQDSEKVIGTSDYNGTPLLVKHVVSGSFIKKRYIKVNRIRRKRYEGRTVITQLNVGYEKVMPSPTLPLKR